MIIIDASVLVNALSGDGKAGQHARMELSRDLHWAAPEHLIIETFASIRNLLVGRKVTQERADSAVRALAAVNIDLVACRSLLPRMWQLRNNITGYDAAYVAAAETQACPLLTADARLARAANSHCEVHLITSA